MIYKNHTITSTARGYEISTVQNGRTIYLETLYRSTAKWTTDYTYSRRYTSIESAKKAIDRII